MMPVPRILSICLAAAAALAVCRPVSADPFFALVGWNGEFARIDATSLDFELVSEDLHHRLQALAFSPDGVLYTGPAKGHIYTINPADGTEEHYIVIDTDIRGMAFSPTGDLYISSRDDELGPTMLRTLSLVDGYHTDVGPLDGVGLHAQGMAFSPDGILYGVRPNADNYDLYTIDLDDLELHIVGSHTGALHQGLTFKPDGSLYALGQSTFAQLDPLTGAILGDTLTLPSDTADYRGLAFIPEPTTLVLLSLAGLGVLRRHKAFRRP